MRKLLSLALVALLVAVSGVAGEKKDPKDMRIGYVMTDRNNVFQNMIADALKARADQYGVQLVILDGENRAEKQVAQIENLVAQFYDGVILNPASFEGVTNGVAAAHAEGVPLITVNQVVSNLSFLCRLRRRRVRAFAGRADPEDDGRQGQARGAARLHGVGTGDQPQDRFDAGSGRRRL